MRLLVDTHVLLWYAREPARLRSIRATLDDPHDTLHVSIVSWWELAIKAHVGRLNVDIDELRVQAAAADIRELPLAWIHARTAITLPRHHGDPFDHLLVAQALTEGMRLVTAERALVPYSDLVWCIA